MWATRVGTQWQQGARTFLGSGKACSCSTRSRARWRRLRLRRTRFKGIILARNQFEPNWLNGCVHIGGQQSFWLVHPHWVVAGTGTHGWSVWGPDLLEVLWKKIIVIQKNKDYMTRPTPFLNHTTVPRLCSGLAFAILIQRNQMMCYAIEHKQNRNIEGLYLVLCWCHPHFWKASTHVASQRFTLSDTSPGDVAC